MYCSLLFVTMEMNGITVDFFLKILWFVAILESVLVNALSPWHPNTYNYTHDYKKCDQINKPRQKI